MAQDPRLSASIHVVIVHLMAGNPVPTDDWCPTCLLPSLVTVPILGITDAGVSPYGHVTVCNDCGTTIT